MARRGQPSITSTKGFGRHAGCLCPSTAPASFRLAEEGNEGWPECSTRFEIKKNGPARIPASTPARRNSFTAAFTVLPVTGKSYGHAQDIINNDRSRSLLVKPAVPLRRPPSGVGRIHRLQ